MSILGGLAIAAGTSFMNNMFAQKNASDAYQREKQLMDKQHSMNVADTVNAHTYNVEGMRMAGLNPALGQGATPAVPETSKGSADMAQTIPFNSADALAAAQVENVKADTDVKRAQVPQIQADIKSKAADILFKSAGVKKIEAETQNINNLNVEFKAQNDALAGFGQVMAQKWQASPWYVGLAPDTRNTIDALAAGEIPMSVGVMAALEKTIGAQKDLSDADRTLVKNAFDNAVSSAMFSDDSVMRAIAQEPKDKRNLLYKHIDEIDAAMKKIDAEIPNIIQNLKNLKSQKNLTDIQAAFEDAKSKAFKAGDLDYLKSQGEYGKWIEKYSEDRLADIFKIVPAVAAGRAAGSAVKVPSPVPESKPMIFKPTPSDYDKFPLGDRNKPWFK